MPIAIIVEDGSNVANANSYASVATVRTYLQNRGVSLPTDDDAVASMILQGMDYLGTKACEWQGDRTYNDPLNPPLQALDWPRTGVCLNGVEQPINAMPAQLVAALSQLVKAVSSGIDLFPNVVASDFVVREKIDVIETEYANPFLVGINPMLSAVDAFLAPLFGKCASGSSLSTVRA